MKIKDDRSVASEAYYDMHILLCIEINLSTKTSSELFKKGLKGLDSLERCNLK